MAYSFDRFWISSTNVRLFNFKSHFDNKKIYNNCCRKCFKASRIYFTFNAVYESISTPEFEGNKHRLMYSYNIIHAPQGSPCLRNWESFLMFFRSLSTTQALQKFIGNHEMRCRLKSCDKWGEKFYFSSRFYLLCHNFLDKLDIECRSYALLNK